VSKREGTKICADYNVGLTKESKASGMYFNKALISKQPNVLQIEMAALPTPLPSAATSAVAPAQNQSLESSADISGDSESGEEENSESDEEENSEGDDSDGESESGNATGNADVNAGPPKAVNRVGLKMEVQACDDDCPMSFCVDCKWELCMVVADNGRTCDVRILEDDELCADIVAHRYLRMPAATVNRKR
jgi:hypothetical protein